MLYEFIRKYVDSREKVEREPGDIFVTDLASGCKYKAEFLERFPEIEMKIQLEPSILLGSFTHSGIQALASDIYENIEVEKSVEKKIEAEGTLWRIRGRVDLIVNGVPIEIKTTKTAYRSEAGEYVSNFPYPHHELQLQIYLWMLEKEYGYLWYFSFDKVAEYKVEARLSDDDIRGLIQKYLAGQRPSWACMYCEFRKICPHAER